MIFGLDPRNLTGHYGLGASVSWFHISYYSSIQGLGIKGLDLGAFHNTLV